jgi:hypothetical protein
VLSTFFTKKWQRPGESVKEIGEPVWMWNAVELADIYHVVFILHYGSFSDRKIKVAIIVCPQTRQQSSKVVLRYQRHLAVHNAYYLCHQLQRNYKFQNLLSTTSKNNYITVMNVKSQTRSTEAKIIKVPGEAPAGLLTSLDKRKISK